MTTYPITEGIEFAREFPASYAQQQMLERGDACSRVRVLQFDGRLDHEALSRSIALVVERHEALRTKLRRQAGVNGRDLWRQLVLEQPPSVFNLVDERNSSPAQQAASLYATLDRELARVGMDAQGVAGATLFRAALILADEKRSVCVLAANAAVLDTFSFEIFLEELRHLYAIETGEARGPHAEPSLQYADWALWEASTGQQLLLPGIPGERRQAQGGQDVFVDRLLSREIEERLLTLRRQESLAVPLTALLILHCRQAGLDMPALLTSGRRLKELKASIGPLEHCLPVVAAHQSFDTASLDAAAAAVRTALDSLGAAPHTASPLAGGESALAIDEPLVLTGQFAPGLRVSWGELATLAPTISEAGSTLTVRLLIAEGRLALGFWSRTLTLPQLSRAADAYLLLLHKHYGHGAPLAVLAAQPLTSAPDAGHAHAALVLPGAAAAEQTPQGEIESKLAEIWSAVLQVEQIGRNENFFDLGGHSLLAVRIGTRIERAFKREIALNAILELPTIAEFATLLASPAEQDSAGDAPRLAEAQHRLVTLQEPGPGIAARLPFFWIPGGRAVSVLALREVSLLLGADRPVYGVESRLPLAGENFLSVPERARLYLNVIREKQPRGPYLLAGFCVGGMVAFEMAQQLKEQGEEVAFLGLLQASMPGFPAAAQERRRMERQRKLYLGRTTLEFLLLRVSPVHRRRSREQRQEVLDRFAKLLTGWVGTSSRLPELTQQTNGQAMQAYRPRLYDGAVHIFLAEDCFESAGITPALDPRRAWSSMARGGAATVVVPGDHVSMLTQAPARSLAEAIRTALPL